jgi:hypothetical protein
MASPPVSSVAPVELVAHARDLEGVDGLAVQHPFGGDHGHDVGMGEDAELIGARSGRPVRGQRDLEDAVVHVAVLQAEVPGHLLHQFAKGEDGRAFVRRHLGVAHGGQGDHAPDAGQHSLLLREPRVQAQQASDVGEVVARKRGACGMALHRLGDFGLAGGGLPQEAGEVGRCGLRLGQRIQRGLLEGVGAGRAAPRQGHAHGKGQGGGFERMVLHGRRSVDEC